MDQFGGSEFTSINSTRISLLSPENGPDTRFPARIFQQLNSIEDARRLDLFPKHNVPILRWTSYSIFLGSAIGMC
jgi:hypothetical protein